MLILEDQMIGILGMGQECDKQWNDCYEKRAEHKENNKFMNFPHWKSGMGAWDKNVVVGMGHELDGFCITKGKEYAEVVAEIGFRVSFQNDRWVVRGGQEDSMGATTILE